MLFRGLREVRTTEPKQLAADLRRLNGAIEDGFAAVELDFERMPRVVSTTEARHQAKHGDFVRPGISQSSLVLLPASTPETAGQSVYVLQTDPSFPVTVVAASGQAVNGDAEVAIGANQGWQRFIDDGLGGFWGPAS